MSDITRPKVIVYSPIRCANERCENESNDGAFAKVVVGSMMFLMCMPCAVRLGKVAAQKEFELRNPS